jgi:NhaP-type Na+/H+ and K+/H+ antiporter
METSETGFRRWAGVGIRILWPLALIVGFFALAIWLWPTGLLETPLSGFTLERVVRAVVSLTFLSVGLTSLYLVVVVPFVHGYAELYSRE